MDGKAGGSDDRFQPPPQAPPPYEPQQRQQQPQMYPHPQVHPQPIYIQQNHGVNVVQPGHTGVIVTQPGNVVLVSPMMGHSPAMMTCTSCNHSIVTRVEYNPACRTHLTALLFCLIGCWPCAFIPYCTPSCMNASHYCPNCNAFIGAYN